MAVAAVGAGVGWGVNQALAGGGFYTEAGVNGGAPTRMPIDPVFAHLGASGEAFVRGLSASFAGGVAASVVRGGGRVGVVQAAVDAFGNALGESFKDALLAPSGGGAYSAGDYTNEMDRASDSYSSAYAGNYVNEMDRASDNYNPASEYGYRNGSDIQSDNYNPAFEYDYRNGSDVASDTYNGSRRTATVKANQGPMAALAGLGLNAAQQQSGYGYLLRSGQVQIGANGAPVVQPGQELHIDLSDNSNSALAVRAIAQESAMRADRAAVAAQSATDSYSNAEARRFANPPPSLSDPVGNVGYGNISDLLLKANKTPWQTELSRDDVFAIRGDLTQALRTSQDPRERQYIRSAFMSLNEAAANKRLLTPDEIIGGPGMMDIAIESGAFGGSNGSVPSGISRTPSYTGPSNRSAFRAHVSNVSEESAPVTFSNLFPEDTPRLANVIPNERLRSVSQNKLAYVVLENGTLIVGKNNQSQGHIDLAGGQSVLAAGEVSVHAGQIKKLDNYSGHYRPSGVDAQRAAETAFQKAGFDANGKYKERQFPK